MEELVLAKRVFDDADLSTMSFHDVHVWSMVPRAEAFEYLLDLDYIFAWVHPKAGETHFKFWVAPATMVFENAYDIALHIDSSQGVIEIADLYTENPGPTRNGVLTEHTYRFECQEGQISVRATGFKLFPRRGPELRSTQSFDLVERGGISFAREMG